MITKMIKMMIMFRRQALEEQEEAIRQLEMRLARQHIRKLQDQVHQFWIRIRGY
jgi:hypothetical protein